MGQSDELDGGERIGAGRGSEVSRFDEAFVFQNLHVEADVLVGSARELAAQVGNVDGVRAGVLAGPHDIAGESEVGLHGVYVSKLWSGIGQPCSQTSAKAASIRSNLRSNRPRPTPSVQ